MAVVVDFSVIGNKLYPSPVCGFSLYRIPNHNINICLFLQECINFSMLKNTVILFTL